MKKSMLVLSFAFMAIAGVTFTACKNSPKPTEKAKATEQVAVAEYQCPMKCEGDKTYSEMGKCPVCGMDLKKIEADSTMQMAVETFQCPMKCEGDKTYNEMGKCPVCGMNLKSIKKDAPEENHEGHMH